MHNKTKRFFLGMLLGILLVLFVPALVTTAVELSPPLNPDKEIIDITPDYIEIRFLWGEVEGTDYYHFYFTSGRDHTAFRTSPELELVGGFGWNELYKWKVGACRGDSNDLNCSYADEQSFITPSQPEDDEDVGGDDGGGDRDRGGGTPAVLENPISSKTLPQLLENVLNFLFGLSIVILPIIIIYASIQLLTASGSPEKISSSRTILLWAVVAFAIILLARGLPPVLRALL